MKPRSFYYSGTQIVQEVAEFTGSGREDKDKAVSAMQTTQNALGVTI